MKLTVLLFAKTPLADCIQRRSSQ